MAHHFLRHNADLFCEGVDLLDIANEFGSPIYVYSAATLERHFRVLDDALADCDRLIAFSVKSNANMAVLATLARLGAGADIVSGGELTRALRAGIPANRIVFSGVGKQAHEMQAALAAGILQFNVESAPELALLAQIAQDQGQVAPFAIRLNPDVEAGGHQKISTGKSGDKFGISFAECEALLRATLPHPSLSFVGLAVHIGSQIKSLEPMERAFSQLFAFAQHLGAQGFSVSRMDLGGGLAIPYLEAENHAQPSDYGTIIRGLSRDFSGRLIFEPGRLIAGNAGILLTRVLYVKESGGRKIAVLDAGMNDLLRPALYDAFHRIEPVHWRDGPLSTYDFVGPICESSDYFGRDRALPPLESGDAIAIFSSGAYGAVMASAYNSRPIIGEVLVSGATGHCVRKPISVEQLLENESLPPWL